MSEEPASIELSPYPAGPASGYGRPPPPILAASDISPLRRIAPEMMADFAGAAGQPVDDLPPIVEFEARPEPIPEQGPASETAAPLQRPERRHFLAPVGPMPNGPMSVGSIATRPQRRPRRPEWKEAAVAIADAPRLDAGGQREAAQPASGAIPHSAPETTWEIPAAIEKLQSPAPLRWIASGPAAVAAVVILVALVVIASIELLHPFSGAPRTTEAPTGATDSPKPPASIPGITAPAAPVPPGPPASDATSGAVQRVADTLARARGGDPKAQLEVAILYAKGDGVVQDYATAATWFRAAAEQGAPRAQYDLGVLYERGRGVPADPAQAVAWYRKSAENNYSLAQYNLAVAYTKGDGTAQDFAQAASWYRRAAQQGVIPAMVNLAILYERGEGVPSSAIDAYAWYRAAGKRGNQAAAKRSNELLQAFAPPDQSRAEGRANEVAGSIKDAVSERPTAAGSPASTTPVLKSGVVIKPPKSGG